MIAIIIATEQIDKCSNTARIIDTKNTTSLVPHFQWAKELTQGSPVLMGFDTFNRAFNYMPLNRRHNIICTRQPDKSLLTSSNMQFITDAEAFFIKNRNSNFTTYVLGGVRMFQLAMPHVQRIYLTEIKRRQALDQGLITISDEFVATEQVNKPKYRHLQFDRDLKAF